jgi:hypothetical protein
MVKRFHRTFLSFGILLGVILCPAAFLFGGDCIIETADGTLVIGEDCYWEGNWLYFKKKGDEDFTLYSFPGEFVSEVQFSDPGSHYRGLDVPIDDEFDYDLIGLRDDEVAQIWEISRAMADHYYDQGIEPTLTELAGYVQEYFLAYHGLYYSHTQIRWVIDIESKRE